MAKRPITVLDIGTGTGLLSLMYAQINPAAQIDALELDQAACNQAAENFNASPWSSRLKAIYDDFKCFNTAVASKTGVYDLIFSNPPFYDSDLKSPDQQRNRAHHSTDLSFKDLLTGAIELLKVDGLFAVLVPFSRSEAFIDGAALVGLFLKNHYKIANAEGKVFFRSVLLFCKKKGNVIEEEIFIRNSKQEYSLKFRELLQPFYLKL